MKFRISMKTPDAVDCAIEDAVINEFGGFPAADDSDTQQTMDDRKDEVAELCKQWFSYGECVTIEIDTVAKTATVLKARG